MMNRFELPRMEIKLFADENIITDSTVIPNETDVALDAWQGINPTKRIVKNLDRTKDLVKFTD